MDLNSLKSQFLSLQKSQSSFKLSERTLVDIINKIKSRGHIKFHHTISGKEYVVDNKINFEILSEVKKNKKISTIDLSQKLELPLNLIENKKIVDNIEINGIKMSFKEIKKTSSFVKKLTLDLPMTYYANNNIGTSDFIFYYSENNNLDVVRILNIPNIFDIVFDIGFMPNEIFPSDHLSLCADFVITN